MIPEMHFRAPARRYTRMKQCAQVAIGKFIQNFSGETSRNVFSENELTRRLRKYNRKLPAVFIFNVAMSKISGFTNSFRRWFRAGAQQKRLQHITYMASML